MNAVGTQRLLWLLALPILIVGPVSTSSGQRCRLLRIWRGRTGCCTATPTARCFRMPRVEPPCATDCTVRVDPPHEASAHPSDAITPPSEVIAETSHAPVETTPPADHWHVLFDGKTMSGWHATEFGGEGGVEVGDGALVMEMGSPLTGIDRTDQVPTGDYELELEAKKLDGHDFFCGLTFPAKDSHCSLIIGGWGGGLVGISSLDGFDASENETARFVSFESDRWYHIRIRVTQTRLQAWIDDESTVDVDITKRKLSTRVEVDLSKPLGICAFETRAAFRYIRWRAIDAAQRSSDESHASE